jgi:hypothetical protein
MPPPELTDKQFDELLGIVYRLANYKGCYDQVIDKFRKMRNSGQWSRTEMIDELLDLVGNTRKSS